MGGGGEGQGGTAPRDTARGQHRTHTDPGAEDLGSNRSRLTAPHAAFGSSLNPSPSFLFWNVGELLRVGFLQGRRHKIRQALRTSEGTGRY